MVTAYVSHPSSKQHEMGPGHPECPQRLDAIERGLRDAGLWEALSHIEAPRANRARIAQGHDEAYVDELYARSPWHGHVSLDPDTRINPHSLTAAEHAAGGVLRAVDCVLTDEFDNAFCAVRPPGHHAERDRAMGFCLFGNVALAALHALDHHGLGRVAIVDFDVHHGNGTEDIVRGDRRILFCSSYQYPLFPFPSNEGVNGHIVKSPLDPGTDGAGFREAIERDWLPALDAFRPELILVSAGFDAHAADPLAGLDLQEEDFAWVTDRVMEVAARHAHGRVVSSLEGGYDLQALAASAAVHVHGLQQTNEPFRRST